MSDPFTAVMGERRGSGRVDPEPPAGPWWTPLEALGAGHAWLAAALTEWHARGLNEIVIEPHDDPPDYRIYTPALSWHGRAMNSSPSARRHSVVAGDDYGISNHHLDGLLELRPAQLRGTPAPGEVACGKLA